MPQTLRRKWGFNTVQKKRCEWAGSDPLYVAYHDREWGVPVHDDQKLFEFLILEGAQAGLSWLTVLRKRENYRKALDGFDPAKIQKYNSSKIKSLLSNDGIIRNRLKIESTIDNAKAYLATQKEFGSFAKYIWGFVSHKPIKNRRRSIKELPASTSLSDVLSKDLKKRGFRFVGSTICYAFMQAVGMVNDHFVHCFRYNDMKE
ncbi:MAG: DNA-3-methyladenine glycosylase I [Candidatus Omnitrophica bacterium]|nr:DNA-3-methyladenine glycosylase I [Candidatus Omnitrophota bacterium]